MSTSGRLSTEFGGFKTENGIMSLSESLPQSSHLSAPSSVVSPHRPQRDAAPGVLACSLQANNLYFKHSHVKKHVANAAASFSIKEKHFIVLFSECNHLVLYTTIIVDVVVTVLISSS